MALILGGAAPDSVEAFAERQREVEAVRADGATRTYGLRFRSGFASRRKERDVRMGLAQRSAHPILSKFSLGQSPHSRGLARHRCAAPLGRAVALRGRQRTRQPVERGLISASANQAERPRRRAAAECDDELREADFLLHFVVELRVEQVDGRVANER